MSHARLLAAGSIVLAIGLGVYAWTLRSDLNALRAELDTARRTAEAAKKTEDAARLEVQPLRENVQRLTAERDRLRAGASTSGTVSSGQTPGAANPDQVANTFVRTLATSEAKALMRSEALSEAKKDFAGLMDKWKLAPGEADQFLQFLADRTAGEQADAIAMLADGKLDEKGIAELERKQQEAREESNRRLRGLLGEARYAEFGAFDARHQELAAVSDYHDHLEAAGHALTEEQRLSLAKIVKAEKPDDNDWNTEEAAFFTKGMTDEQLTRVRHAQEARQQKIAQQAASFLSPDQISALQAAFKKENDEAELGLKMVRNLFQTGGNAAPSAPR